MNKFYSVVAALFLSILTFGWNDASAAWPDADTVVIYVLDVTLTTTHPDFLVTPSCGNPQSGATPVLPQFASIDGGRSSVRLHCAIQALLNLNEQATDYGYVGRTGLVFYPTANRTDYSGTALYAPGLRLVAPDEVNSLGQNLFELAARSVSQSLHGSLNYLGAHIELPIRVFPTPDTRCSYLCQAAKLANEARTVHGMKRMMIVLITDNYDNFQQSHLDQMRRWGPTPEIHVITFDLSTNRKTSVVYSFHFLLNCFYQFLAIKWFCDIAVSSSVKSVIHIAHRGFSSQHNYRYILSRGIFC